MLANDSKTVWGLIQHNRFEEAIELADELFEKEGDIFEQRNKRIALIHLGKYNEVVNLSTDIIGVRAGENANDYVFRGLAYFFSGNKDAAIKDWLSARLCKYQDASGGISVFSILYFACVTGADLDLRRVVMDGVKKGLKDR